MGNKLPTTESQARELAPLDPELQKAVWQVASHIEFVRRRTNLSWAHHAEVASLPPAKQDEWQDARHRQETHAATTSHTA